MTTTTDPMTTKARPTSRGLERAQAIEGTPGIYSRAIAMHFCYCAKRDTEERRA
ncbi:hypothetical protein DOTSEDRAFT_47679 [Dothistroma septosporum NZE10]|uniref:Uncharacterized protein n=1 Tax=Dothistroma septosporum (strain NZE10 / CBS 128990) TaxID=675120 RepID=N1PCP3_DOTSN|nr:hypothetical protein DOTSEDRAFT_47679 [Dothistroma septosporum NZE10]